MLSPLRIAALAAAFPTLLLAQAKPAAPPPGSVTSDSAGAIRVEKLATLEFPWAVAALPDGRLLITEKPGRLRIYEKGVLSQPVTGAARITGGQSSAMATTMTSRRRDAGA